MNDLDNIMIKWSRCPQDPTICFLNTALKDPKLTEGLIYTLIENHWKLTGLPKDIANYDKKTYIYEGCLEALKHFEGREINKWNLDKYKEKVIEEIQKSIIDNIKYKETLKILKEDENT